MASQVMQRYRTAAARSNQVGRFSVPPGFSLLLLLRCLFFQIAAVHQELIARMVELYEKYQGVCGYDKEVVVV